MLKIFKKLKRQEEQIKELEAELNNLRMLEYYVRTNSSYKAYECIRRKQYHRIIVDVK